MDFASDAEKQDFFVNLNFKSNSSSLFYGEMIHIRKHVDAVHSRCTTAITHKSKANSKDF